MSNRDKNNPNSQQIFNEDITKSLVKKILDDNIENDVKEDKEANTSSFNIEYEEYDDEYEEYDDEYEEYDDEYEEYDEDDDYYDDYEDEVKRKHKRKEKNKNNKKEKSYRKNIEIYGKDFFEDESDYDEPTSSIIGKVISFSIIIALTISTSVLAFSLIKTKSELIKANKQVEELLDDKIKTENKLEEEALKNENERLKAENESLKANSKTENTEKQTENVNTTNTSKNNNSNKITDNKATINNSNNSTSSEYIVKEGDVIWNISKQIYGNGAYYKKILDANKLTENSVLTPGQKLIIPKLN